MKIVTNNKNIKVASKGRVKTYNPFLIIEDEDLNLFIESGYTEVTELHNLAEMKEISEIINNKILEFNKSLEEVNDNVSEIRKLKDTVKNNVDNIEQMYNNIMKYLAEIKAHTQENVLLKERLIKITLDGEKQAKIFNDEINNIKEKTINDIKYLSSILFNEIDEKVALYTNVDDNIRTVYKKAEDNIKNLLELAQKSITDSVAVARAWASNPVGVVVEQGLYSARHYSMRAKGDI